MARFKERKDEVGRVEMTAWKGSWLMSQREFCGSDDSVDDCSTCNRAMMRRGSKAAHKP
ncbi:MAG: hypothetical protein HC904_17335 [Blastochloris sp.]|nr:hypothetical protein [Blastochloris sp.]